MKTKVCAGCGKSRWITSFKNLVTKRESKYCHKCITLSPYKRAIERSYKYPAKNTEIWRVYERVKKREYRNRQKEGGSLNKNKYSILHILTAAELSEVSPIEAGNIALLLDEVVSNLNRVKQIAV